MRVLEFKLGVSSIVDMLKKSVKLPDLSIFNPKYYCMKVIVHSSMRHKKQPTNNWISEKRY